MEKEKRKDENNKRKIQKIEIKGKNKIIKQEIIMKRK